MKYLYQNNVSEVNCEVVFFKGEVPVKHFSMLSKKDVREYITCLWHDYLLIYCFFDLLLVFWQLQGSQ